MTQVEQRSFVGAGVTIAADVAGAPDAVPVVFLPGGGQTRAAWGRALPAVADAGFRGVSVDLRGHGDSGWAADQDYRLAAHAADLRALLGQLDDRPFLVGASLGGLAALTVAAAEPDRVRGLVLVDVVPRVERKGTDRIRRFMTGRRDGFASIDEAADAVAAYLPHRPRPKDTSGLMKNLRLRGGRYHWHWDPAISDDRRYEIPTAR